VAKRTNSPHLYLDRELSWLDFNHRVLSTAFRKDVPLLERLKFVSIAASNLDEFYMVRVAAKLRAIEHEKQSPQLSRRQIPAVLLMQQIIEKTNKQIQLSIEILHGHLIPKLAAQGIHYRKAEELSKAHNSELTDYYAKEVHPILTPIAVDPAHPLPRLRNLSLNLALRIIPSSKLSKKRKASAPTEEQGRDLFALVQVPSMLSPYFVIPTESSEHLFVSLDDIISTNASELFPGHEIVESHPFRITRASDLDLIENETENLIVSMQDILRRRERGEAVRLETTSSMSSDLRSLLVDKLDVDPDHIHEYPSLIISNGLAALSTIDRPDLKFSPHTPVINPSLRYDQNVFKRILERDILLHHPYESFSHIVDFMNQAADDPNVVAIKQTFYRTSGDSPLVRALSRAAANGKQVTALVELKARFDEANNIQWAQELERDGVHVVYGLLGLKTHAKLALVIRREGDKLNRYLHLGTGNYNPATARQYTDLSLFTANAEITKDAMLLFNVLTGYADLPEMNSLLVAPFNLRERIEEKILRECHHVSQGKAGHIIIKINSLADYDIADALYEASQAGVRIDLLVRGICCLKPQIEGVSDNIHVRSTIDRFLEHARIFWFRNDGDEEAYLSSADWMPRNLNRRIEIAWPALDPELKHRIRYEVLAAELDDNSSGWLLDDQGEYTLTRAKKGHARTQVQAQLIDNAERQSAGFGSQAKRELITGRPFSYPDT
jgi:polyphosphate kinase